MLFDDFSGIVENVGLKTTRLRSLSGEVLVFSNGDLTKSRLRNYKLMNERRIPFTFGLTFDATPEQLEQVPVAIKKVIDAQNQARFDRAHFTGFGSSSLDFEVVYWMLTPDYAAYRDVQQAVNLGLMREFVTLGVDFAFPTRTQMFSKQSPVAVSQAQGSPNGIIPAIKGFFSHVDKAVWVAWKKKPPAGKAQDFERRITVSDSYGNYDVVRLPLDAAKIHQFYHVTSKEALWPVIHTFPWLYSTENIQWADFREVNRRFAEAACTEAEQGAVVWVHDYNLWLVPGFVRKMRPDLKIAFFHHTQFPGPDAFNILPWRDEIIDSLLSCDLVGFHVPRFAQNFCAVVESLREGVVRHEAPVRLPIIQRACALSEPRVTVQLDVEGRSIVIDTCPIGTAPALIAQTVNSPEGKARTERIRKDMNTEILIQDLRKTAPASLFLLAVRLYCLRRNA